MCTLRALWVLKENNHGGADIILSKRINTVENRVRALSGSNYNPIPIDNELIILFNNELIKDSQGFPQQTQQQQQQQQQQQHQTPSMYNNGSTSLLSASMASKQKHQQQSSTNYQSNSTSLVKTYTNTPNTHIISLDNDKLWPFIYIKKKNHFYITIPVIEEYLIANRRPSLIDLPSITAALNFLEETSIYMSSFFNKAPPYPELQVFLTNIIPFGQPIDTNFNNVKTMIRQGFPTTETFQGQKRPTWKPFLHKGKQQLDFIISENIQCILYDNPSIPDVSKVSGSLICKADLEGMPEVSFYLQPTIASSGVGGIIGQNEPVITNLSIDSSVQTTSDININNKISFNPPLDHFKLLSYSVSGIKSVPLRGFYQMKETSPNSVKILIQLKLNSEMNNSFEFCLLKIPFKNRGNIHHVNASPTTGSIHIDHNLKAVIWNIGQKFTGRNLEVALPIEVIFTQQVSPPQPPTLIVSSSSGNQNITAFPKPDQSFPIIDSSQSDLDESNSPDPFCIGSNSFIRIYIKIQNCTLSGLNIDPKKVVIYPTNKFKLNIEREILSFDYIIWNSLGSSKYSYQPLSNK